MALLENHLQQISLSAAAISDLPFPPPKIFANALLRNHDITTLIRDTEAHERALFSVDPSTTSRRTTRRGTMLAGGEVESMASRINAARDPRKQSAVATVLGRNMMQDIERSTRSGISNTGTGEGRGKGEIDIEVLLRGAEKLCNVYSITGTREKIASIRNNHQQVVESISHYEDKVARQAQELERMYRSQDLRDFNGEEDLDADGETEDIQDNILVTEEDLERERQEIRELELKKRTLEDRVSGMERDLGGLMR